MRNPPFAPSAVVLVLSASLVGPVAAQVTPSRPSLSGDWSYSRASGSDGYAANSLGVSASWGQLPVTLTLDATQNLVDAVETGTQIAASASWKVSPLWSVTPRASTASDATTNVTGRGLAVNWRLHRLWSGKRATRLELGRDVYDYALQSGAWAGRLPQQTQTHIELQQELTPALMITAGWDTYAYSSDPADLARILVKRKVRRAVGAASRLGDMMDQSQSLGLNVALGQDWSVDVSALRSRTVIGQEQRQWNLGLSWMWHPRSALTLSYGDAHSDAVYAPTGLQLSPAQSDSSMELGIRWLY